MKTTTEILQLIKAKNYSYNQFDDSLYIKLVADPKCTHALYGVYQDSLDWYKAQIKRIGGKYIRIVKSGYEKFYIICFRLLDCDIKCT